MPIIPQLVEVSIRPWHQFSEQLFEKEDTSLQKEVLLGQSKNMVRQTTQEPTGFPYGVGICFNSQIMEGILLEQLV